MPKFDTIFKEIIFTAGKSILQDFFGINIQKLEPLPFEFPKVEHKVADFVAKVLIQDKEYIFHIEFQNYNDPKMLHRMLRYKVEIENAYNLPVKQVVIYTGKEKMNMQTKREEKDEFSEFLFSYKVVDLSSMEPERFLGSEKPESILLAILCRVPNPSEIVSKILERIIKIAPKEKIDYYICILEIFSEYRGFNNVVEKEVKSMGIRFMGIDFDYKKSMFYKEGFEEGEKEGLYEALSVGIELKFGKNFLYIMEKIKKIEDIKRLRSLKKEVLKAKSFKDFESKVNSK